MYLLLQKYRYPMHPAEQRPHGSMLRTAPDRVKSTVGFQGGKVRGERTTSHLGPSTSKKAWTVDATQHSSSPMGRAGQRDEGKQMPNSDLVVTSARIVSCPQFRLGSILI